MNLRLTACILSLAVVSGSVRPMNAQDAAKPDTVDLTTVYESREFKGADGGVLRYRLLKPVGFDAQKIDSKAQYPLVLFLHGAGERGDDNKAQLVHGARDLAADALRVRHPAFIVIPQCPAGKKWVEVDWTARQHTAAEKPSDAMQLVLEALQALGKEFPVDQSRIYGVGLSMGGYGTWDLLQREPVLLAAAAPICGGGDSVTVEKFKTTPLWAFHGSDDDAVPVERSREMIAALKAVGGRPIYTEYEGVGHDSWSATFANRAVWDWLFAQQKK